VRWNTRLAPWDPGITRSREPPRHGTRLRSLLLKLLLPLLEFLEKLFGCLDVLLSILLLLLVIGCSLIISLISLISLIALIIGRVIGCVSRIICGVGRRILSLDDNCICSSHSCRGRHRSHHMGIRVDGRGARLLSRSLRSIERTTRFGQKNHSIQGARIGWRTEQKVVEMRSVQEQCQDVTGGRRAELPYNPLRSGTRIFYRCTGLYPNRLQNVSQGRILGGDGQLAALERNLRSCRRQLGQRRRRGRGGLRRSLARGRRLTGRKAILSSITLPHQQQAHETHAQQKIQPQRLTYM
jgi:hypothetical protein